MDTKLLDTQAAAAMLGISKSLLDHDRVRPTLRVPYLRIGAAVRYDPAALLVWARARMVHAPDPQAQQQAQPTPQPRRPGRPREAT